jgi:hypothetical protein
MRIRPDLDHEHWVDSVRKFHQKQFYRIFFATDRKGKPVFLLSLCLLSFMAPLSVTNLLNDNLSLHNLRDNNNLVAGVRFLYDNHSIFFFFLFLALTRLVKTQQLQNCHLSQILEGQAVRRKNQWESSSCWTNSRMPLTICLPGE